MSAFFVARGRDVEDDNVEDDNVEVGDYECDDKRALFAAAALDLLMVLHARVPRSGNGDNNGGGNGNGKSKLDGIAAINESTRVTGAITPAAAPGALPLPRASSPQSTAAVATAAVATAAVATTATAQLSTGVGSAKGGGDRLGSDYEEGGREHGGIAAGGVDAWMVILRALSLGARGGERGVRMHALQLLTKVGLLGPRECLFVSPVVFLVVVVGNELCRGRGAFSLLYSDRFCRVYITNSRVFWKYKPR